MVELILSAPPESNKTKSVLLIPPNFFFSLISCVLQYPLLSLCVSSFSSDNGCLHYLLSYLFVGLACLALCYGNEVWCPLRQHRNTR